MKSLFALVLGTALVTGTLPTFAGGPVLIEDRYDAEVAAARPQSGAALPIIAGLILICIIACGGGGDDAPPVKPADPCNGC